jgi:hypothetical protein
MFFSNFPATASGSFLGAALTVGFLCDSAGGSFLFFTRTRLPTSEGSIATRLREVIIWTDTEALRTRFLLRIDYSKLTSDAHNAPMHAAYPGVPWLRVR